MKNRERQRENKKRARPNCPNNRCASYRSGVCLALDVNDFGVRPCPFFKTVEEAQHEREATMERLQELGREDLIRKYKLRGRKNNEC